MNAVRDNATDNERRTASDFNALVTGPSSVIGLKSANGSAGSAATAAAAAATVQSKPTILSQISPTTAVTTVPGLGPRMISASDKEAMKEMDCNKRLRSLTRLASMVTLVVKASGTPTVQDPSSISIAQVPQQVSVDVVNHFINTDLPGLLTAALSSIPLGHPLACDAINAILDPLEMITRPKLLANLDKLNAATIASNNKSTEIPRVVGPISGENIDNLSGIGSSSNEVVSTEINEGYHRLPEDSEVERNGEREEEEESASGMVTMASGPSLIRGDTNILPGVNIGQIRINTTQGTDRGRNDGSGGDDQSRSFSTGNGNDDSDGSDTGMNLDLTPRNIARDRDRDRDRTNIDLASGNTNARTSRNVYNGSISSATLPSDEGLFGYDDADVDEEEGDEEEVVEVDYNDDCADEEEEDDNDIDEADASGGEFEEDEEEDEDDEDDFDIRDDEDEDGDEEEDDDDGMGQDGNNIDRGIEAHIRQTRRYFSSPATLGYRTERVERASR